MNVDLNLEQARQLESLVAQVIDGRLSDNQSAQLVALLQNPAARRRYRAAMAVHAQLVWLASQARQALPPEQLQEVA